MVADMTIFGAMEAVVRQAARLEAFPASAATTPRGKAGSERRFLARIYSACRCWLMIASATRIPETKAPGLDGMQDDASTVHRRLTARQK